MELLYIEAQKWNHSNLGFLLVCPKSCNACNQLLPTTLRHVAMSSTVEGLKCHLILLSNDGGIHSWLSLSRQTSIMLYHIIENHWFTSTLQGPKAWEVRHRLNDWETQRLKGSCDTYSLALAFFTWTDGCIVTCHVVGRSSLRNGDRTWIGRIGRKMPTEFAYIC